MSSGTVAMSLTADCRGSADFAARYDNAFAVRRIIPVIQVPTLDAAGAVALVGALIVAAALALRRARA